MEKIGKSQIGAKDKICAFQHGSFSVNYARYGYFIRWRGSRQSKRLGDINMKCTKKLTFSACHQVML